MSILGNRVLRTEDPRFLTDGARFVADIDLPGAVHAVFLRSTMAAGAILEIDVAEARTAPGVVGVFTGNDLDLSPYSNDGKEHLERPPLVTERVRFSGEPIAVVVAESVEQAIDASELVLVDIDPVDAVPTIEAGLAGEILVAPELGTNVVDDRSSADLDMSGCEVMIEAEIVNSRINGAAIEPRVAAVRWEGEVLHCWSSTQGAHPAQQTIMSVLDLPAEQVRITTADVGGSFGSKATPGAEESILGAVARAIARPVRWAETRTENLLAMGHGRSQRNRVRLGGTRDGLLTHYQLDIVAEAGAYPEASSFLPYFTQIMATGVYDIEHAACGWQSVLTNTPPVAAFRGAGRPEATATLERAIDIFATEIGMDPIELRRRNMIGADRFPFTTPMGQVYDSGDYVMALERATESAGYAELRRQQAERRSAGSSRLLGIGIASYVEITAPNPSPGQNEHGSIELQSDGSVVARTGSTPYGQGHETTWAMIVADATGVPFDRITVLWGDTDEIPSSGITGGSRSVQLAGSAMLDASTRLVDQARTVAATALEAAPDDIVHDAATGMFHVAGTPARAVGWADIASTNGTELLTAESEFGQDGCTFPFGTHVAVVEVDVETGGVELLRFVTVDDAGTLINPLIAEGQVHGGIAAGVSQALFEEVHYDEWGNLTTANLADYALPAASEFPSFEVTLTETPSPLNPLGAKGIGEAGSIGATPAVQNAVIDALAHVGVRHLDMPATPSKVWSAYTKATAGDPA